MNSHLRGRAGGGTLRTIHEHYRRLDIAENEIHVTIVSLESKIRTRFSICAGEHIGRFKVRMMKRRT